MDLIVANATYLSAIWHTVPDQLFAISGFTNDAPFQATVACFH